MPSPNPLAEAEVLYSYGRTTQAIRVLREALRADPNQPDLTAKLVELETYSASPPPANLRALLIPWLFFLASGGVVLGPLVSAAGLLDEPPLSHIVGQSPLVTVAAGVVILVGAILLWVYLFLHVWFRYLRGLPVAHRAAIESALPRYLNVYAFEPTYSRMRKKYLGGNDGA